MLLILRCDPKVTIGNLLLILQQEVLCAEVSAKNR